MLVVVTYQQYECGLFSKSVNKDSAFRKQHSPSAHLLKYTLFVPQNFAELLFLISPGYYGRSKRSAYTKCLGGKQGVLRKMCRTGMEPSPVSEVCNLGQKVLRIIHFVMHGGHT